MAYSDSNISELLIYLERIDSLLQGTNDSQRAELVTALKTTLNTGILSILASEVNYSNAVSGLTAINVQTAVDELDTLLDKLKANETIITYFEVISGASGGTVSKPTGATIQLDKFYNSGDAILSRIDGSNNLTGEVPRNAGGDLITATMDTAGVYTLSGTAVDANIAIIYVFSIKSEDRGNVNLSQVVEENDVNDHSQLNGLTKDDHLQYLTDARGDVKYEDLFENLVITITDTLTTGNKNISVTTAGIILSFVASPVDGIQLNINNDSGGQITLDGNGNNIYDATTFVLYDAESLHLVFNNSKWNVI